MDSTNVSLTGSTTYPSLQWSRETGIGYLDPGESPTAIYDEAYFDMYVDRADSEIGRALTAGRVAMVARHYDGPVLDVGIGSGQFVQARPDTYGYDVNPAGVSMLRERGIYRDLYADQYPALTFWDALEHIPEPELAVARASRFVFVSLPIFTGPWDCLNSKHYKPGEHIWYFSDRGIRGWFAAQGFECIEYSDFETTIGREGIGSYVFRRVSDNG